MWTFSSCIGLTAGSAERGYSANLQPKKQHTRNSIIRRQKQSWLVRVRQAASAEGLNTCPQSPATPFRSLAACPTSPSRRDEAPSEAKAKGERGGVAGNNSKQQRTQVKRWGANKSQRFRTGDKWLRQYVHQLCVLPLKQSIVCTNETKGFLQCSSFCRGLLAYTRHIVNSVKAFTSILVAEWSR